MKLIGMLDSPFVRRTAIGLDLLGLTFEHQPLSVFRDFDQFAKLNPMVKAPTLILDDGTVLVDSNLILQFAEALSERSLFQTEDLAVQMQVLGISSIANEKTVQRVYEEQIRPAEKRHQPWVDRIQQQLNQTFAQLEALLAAHPHLCSVDTLNHASIAAAVSWFFVHHMRPGTLDIEGYPTLARWSAEAETSNVFQRYPYDFSMS